MPHNDSSHCRSTGCRLVGFSCIIDRTNLNLFVESGRFWQYPDFEDISPDKNSALPGSESSFSAYRRFQIAVFHSGLFMLAKYPNFLLVGAAKSGTSSLFHYLNQHPDIFMSPVKEPLFFCSYGVEEKALETELYPFPMKDVVSTMEAYSDLYSGAVHETAIGEASVYYLLDHKKTISNIKELVPDWSKLKIIITLRNPVESCFSNYLMYNQYFQHFLKKKNLPTFEESFKLESERLRNGNLVLANFHWFLYFEQVKDYLDNFENVRIFLHSDMKQDLQGVTREIFDYLGVDSTFTPSLAGQEFNVSGVPKNGAIYRLLAAPSPIKAALKPLLYFFISRERKEKVVNYLLRKSMSKPVMKEETRSSLKEFYRDDIVKLQELIGRDLTDWLK